MQLEIGMAAPDFETADVFGNPIRLKGLAGKPLLLSFFRNAACAMCNLRVHKLIQKYPVYHAAGLEIITIFESPKESITEYVGKQAAPFPIIADPEAHLYNLYGVEISESKVEQTMALPELPAYVAEAAAAGFVLTKEPGSNFYRMPADFLINEQGMISAVRYAEFVQDHMPFEVIEDFLAVRK
jgi:peroxiredoxin